MDLELKSGRHSVLQDADASVTAGEPQRRWRKEPVGVFLEEARTRLLSLGAELQGHVEEHTVPLLEEARKQLREASCRIAIIGQIKAGKSTFVNALAENPGLLPSDINPSTVVVTTLNFRKGSPPEHAAVFQFFSADEWAELAEGGGTLRRLTERLVPGFKPGLLRAQLDFVRKRAERRLGPRFGELLGKSHSYRELSAEVLADYVSAGDYKDAGATSRPHYSDITRSADLFFPDGPFAFPVTLVDTPGNNDPFLVRDEITRRALDNPDIFVFVLSALQPLSAADIAMLRLLNGLHKDRIIVFVNRADQLADPVTDAAAVKAAVERRLRAEFPAIDIPVIIGSSRWGNLGLLAEHVDLRSHLSAAHVGLLLDGEPARASSASPAATVQERLSQALYTRSGLPQVAAAMTRSMASSNTALLIRQVAAIFLEIARSTELFARAELRSIDDHLAARQLEATMLGEKVAADQEALRLLEERVGALRDTFRHIETHFRELIASGAESLRSDLQRLVHEFSDREAQTVLVAQATRGSRPPRACNVMPLRVRLETAYLQAFDQLAGDLMRIESFLYPQLKAIVASLSSDTPSGYLEPPAEPMQPLPSAPLSVTVALDLGERWWKMWLAGRPTPQEQADHLRRLIDAEFAGVVDELVRLAQMRLAERADHTLRRLNAVSDGLLSGVEKRRSLLATEYSRLHKLGEEAIRQSDGGLAQRTCAAALAACSAVGEELVGLIAGLEAAPGETEHDRAAATSASE